MKTAIKAPADLSESSKKFWQEIFEQYNLEPHHLKLLNAACVMLDGATAAEKAIKQHGEYHLDRHGVWRSHPAIADRKACLAQFARLLKAIGIGYSRRSGPGRPEEGSEGI